MDRVITAPADWAQNNNDDLLFAHYKAVAQELPIMLMTALGKRPVPLNVIEETVNTVPELIAIKDDICRHYGHICPERRRDAAFRRAYGRPFGSSIPMAPIPGCPFLCSLCRASSGVTGRPCRRGICRLELTVL